MKFWKIRVLWEPAKVLIILDHEKHDRMHTPLHKSIPGGPQCLKQIKGACVASKPMWFTVSLYAVLVHFREDATEVVNRWICSKKSSYSNVVTEMPGKEVNIVMHRAFRCKASSIVKNSHHPIDIGIFVTEVCMELLNEMSIAFAWSLASFSFNINPPLITCTGREILVCALYVFI